MAFDIEVKTGALPGELINFDIVFDDATAAGIVPNGLMLYYNRFDNGVSLNPAEETSVMDSWGITDGTNTYCIARSDRHGGNDSDSDSVQVEDGTILAGVSSSTPTFSERASFVSFGTGKVTINMGTGTRLSTYVAVAIKADNFTVNKINVASNSEQTLSLGYQADAWAAMSAGNNPWSDTGIFVPDGWMCYGFGVRSNEAAAGAIGQSCQSWGMADALADTEVNRLSAPDALVVLNNNSNPASGFPYTGDESVKVGTITSTELQLTGLAGTLTTGDINGMIATWTTDGAKTVHQLADVALASLPLHLPTGESLGGAPQAVLGICSRGDIANFGVQDSAGNRAVAGYCFSSSPRNGSNTGQEAGVYLHNWEGRSKVTCGGWVASSFWNINNNRDLGAANDLTAEMTTFTNTGATLGNIDMDGTRGLMYVMFETGVDIAGGPTGATITSTGIASIEVIGSHTLSPGAAPAITPAGIAEALAFGTHVVKPLSAITSTGIVGVESIGSHTVSPGVAPAITVTGISSVVSIGTHTVNIGVWPITVTGIASVQGIGAPTIRPASAITIIGIVSIEGVGSHTISVGAAPITVTGITSAVSIGTHTVSPGIAPAITSTGITSIQSIGTHVVGPGAAPGITVTGIASVEGIGSHTVTAPAAGNTIAPTGITSVEAVGSADIRVRVLRHNAAAAADGFGSSDTISYPIVAGSSRFLTVSVCQEGTDVDTPQPSVLYGDQSLFLIGSRTQTFLAGGALSRIDSYGLREVSIAAAVGTDVVVSNVVPKRSMHVSSYSNVEQKIPILETAAASADDTPPNPLTPSLAAINSSATIATAMNSEGNASNDATWGGTVPVIEQSEVFGTLSGVNALLSSMADRLDVADETVNAEATFSFTGGPNGYAITLMAELAAGGPATIIEGAGRSIGSVESVGAPTITSVAPTVIPTGIASIQSIGTHVLTNQATITPTGIASIQAIGAHVVRGSISITITGIASALSIGSHNVGAGVESIIVTGIASVESIGSHVVTPGAAPGITVTGIASVVGIGSHTVLNVNNLVVTGISSVQGIGTHVLTHLATITPTGISTVAAIGSHVISSGSLSISITGIASVQSIGTHVLTVGVVNITPTGISSTQAIGSHTVGIAAANISPAGIGSAQAIGTHVITRTGAAPINTTGISSIESVGSHTVGATSSITVTGISSVVSVGAPVVTSSVDITLTGISELESVPNPTVGVGAVSIVPSGLPTVESVPNPSVANALSISISAIASVQVVPQPVISAGAVSIVVGGITGQESVGTHVIGNALSIVPAGITTQVSVAAPVVTVGSVTITATGIASAISFGSPSVGLTIQVVTVTGIASVVAVGTHTITRQVFSTGKVSVGQNHPSADRPLSAPKIPVRRPTRLGSGINRGGTARKNDLRGV